MDFFRVTSPLWGESVNGGFPSQRPVTQSVDVFVDVRLNKQIVTPVSWDAIVVIMTSLLCVFHESTSVVGETELVNKDPNIPIWLLIVTYWPFHMYLGK